MRDRQNSKMIIIEQEFDKLSSVVTPILNKKFRPK